MNDFNYPPILFKYLDYDGGKAMLENESLMFNRPSNLNDKYDCRQGVPTKADYDVIGTVEIDFDCIFNTYVRVCSLTSDPTNLRMWKKYARQHTGLCLGINMEVVGKQIGYHEAEKRVIFVKKVTYNKGRPQITPYAFVSDKFPNITHVDDEFIETRTEMNRFLSTKTIDWRYEKEWRLMLWEGTAQTKVRVFGMIPNLITCVYLGSLFPLNGRPEILRIAKARGLKVFQTKIYSNGQRMKSIEIT